jgi:hypothetical protein
MVAFPKNWGREGSKIKNECRTLKQHLKSEGATLVGIGWTEALREIFHLNRDKGRVNRNSTGDR